MMHYKQDYLILVPDVATRDRHIFKCQAGRPNTGLEGTTKTAVRLKGLACLHGQGGVGRVAICLLTFLMPLRLANADSHEIRSGLCWP
jgi:hypothetical protein